MGAVRKAILGKVQAAIAGGVVTVNGTAIDTSTNALVDLDVTSSHGSKALALTFTTAPAGASSATITVLPKDLTVGGKPVIGFVGGSDGAGGTFTDYTTMGKVLWNYLLVANDSSFGVHNPSFALDVLARTQAQVAALADGAFPY